MIHLHVTCDATECHQMFYPEMDGRQRARHEAHAHEWVTTRTRDHRIVDLCPHHALAYQAGVEATIGSA